MRRLSAAAARRIVLAAQGLTDRRPVGRVDRRHVRRVFDRVGVVQIDSVNVLVRSHYLLLFSRLGPYDPGLLDRMAGHDRELFEYWGHMASFLPVEVHPLFRWKMERAATGDFWPHLAAIIESRPGFVEAVYAEVAERGPLSAGELGDPGEKRGAWWGWADGKLALEWLFFTGRVTTAERRNFERRYDLTERVIPPAVLELPAPSEDEARGALLMRAARSLGVATERDLCDYYRLNIPQSRPALRRLVEQGDLIAVSVDGWSSPALLHPLAKMPRRITARALLSPFDSLVWDRSRAERLFDFHYRIEIYVPAPKRVYGYFVLPFLLDDRLAARVDLKADRKAGALLVRGAYAEDGEDRGRVAAELAVEVASMTEWLGLAGIEVTGPGDLVAPLRAAVARGQ